TGEAGRSIMGEEISAAPRGPPALRVFFPPPRSSRPRDVLLEPHAPVTARATLVGRPFPAYVIGPSTLVGSSGSLARRSRFGLGSRSRALPGRYKAAWVG